MRIDVVFLSATLLGCLGAQPRIGPAALGYAYDPAAGAIRSVIGTPGAAILGEAYATDFAMAGAVIAPLQNYAIAIGPGGNVAILRGLPATSSPDAIDAAAADHIVFSPSGAAALLYGSGSASMQVVTGLPDRPAVRNIAAALPGRSAVAVRDDGAVAAAADEGVRIFAPDANSFLLPLAGAVALAFEPSGSRLAAVTNSGDIYLIAGLQDGLDLRRVASAAIDGEIVGAQFASDGSGVVIAATDGAVAMVDFAAGTVRSRNCGCAPTGLDAFGRPGLFRLTGVSDRPLMIVDAAADGPRFWFVPPVSPRSAQ